MDDAERRNPGLALAGTYRDGVALGDAIASGEQAAGRGSSGANLGDTEADAQGRIEPPGPRFESVPGAAHWRSGRRSGFAIAVEAKGYDTERIEIRTTGDLVQDVPLAQYRDPSALHQADRRCVAGGPDRSRGALAQGPPDRASQPGSRWPPSAEREDPRDALVGRASVRWEDLPRAA